MLYCIYTSGTVDKSELTQKNDALYDFCAFVDSLPVHTQLG